MALGTPAVGTTVTWGQSVTLTATAADSDGTIARVEFYDGTTKIGEDATAPYEFTWTNAPAGTRTLTARAIDNAGGSTVSAERTLVVSNTAPTVSVTAPAPNAAVSSGHAVKITATASDAEGPVARVEFYDGATKLGESTAAPYEFNWTNPPTGTHTLTARAFDGAGASTTSAAQTLAVVDVEGAWASLGAGLQGGITAAPSKPIEAGGLDAIEVLTAVGTNTVAPVWRAAMAQAAKSMATANFTPAGGFLDCAGGGRMIVAPGAGTRRLVSFDNCVLGGFTFYGGVNVAPYSHTSVTGANPGTFTIGSTVNWDPTADGFTLTIDGVRVTGNGAPDPGTGDYPRNALGATTTVTCSGSGAALSCLTTYATGNHWGTDLVWDSFAAGTLATPAAGALYATDDSWRVNGTFRGGFGGGSERNIRFEDFTPTSGRAIVYGNNGWSVVTRLAPLSPGVEQLQVKRFLTAEVTVGSVTYPVGPGPTQRYRCEVGAVGDWDCTLIVGP
ncbi:MAG: Ig-like domain-containing protein [Rubrivivax sp.]